jgi:glycine cleavage system H protein
MVSFLSTGPLAHKSSSKGTHAMNLTVPPELYYTKNHEWASVDENVVTVGLTGYRLNEIGEVLFLDLPEDGKTVRQDEPFSTIEGVKVVHDFISPMTGIILEVNEALYDDPAKLNDDPYNEGWLVKIELDKEAELAKLMRAPEYRKYINLTSGVADEPQEATTTGNKNFDDLEDEELEEDLDSDDDEQ